MRITLPPQIEAITPDQGLIEISHRLANKDHTIWGEGTEAAIRLGWVDLPERSRTLLPLLDALTARMRDERFERIVLSGMGGSSLAPEVIAKSYAEYSSRELILMDSTNPDLVGSILNQDHSKTLFVISSKSGSTIETTSHLAAIEAALLRSGLDVGSHIIVITDPGSPLESLARERSWQVVLGDPHVGGRFSALSAFGLVPTALIGIDPSLLLDDASEMLSEIHLPAAKLALHLATQRFIYIKDSASPVPGLGDWIEQLIAESTGKSGVGILPISLGKSAAQTNREILDFTSTFTAPLGAQFILWEWVTALLGYLLDVDPFDQPDVQATKAKTSEALEHISSLNPAEGSLPLDQLFSAFESNLQGREYVAICAYLDPRRASEIFALRELLEKRFGLPVAFGWGPRFLHSTGQFHKGGPRCGLFLSITSDSKRKVEIPGREFGFQELILAQAAGDRMALIESGNPVIRIHLADVETGTAGLLKLFV